MTRIALFGYGPWARNCHRTIDSIGGVEIHSVCRLRPDLAPAGLRRRIRFTSDPSEALDGADAAIVATPPEAHRDAACAALRMGLPVMLEKPVALTLEDVDVILEEADRMRLPVMVDHVHLFSSAFEELRSMVRSWSPVTIESEGGAPGPVRDYSPLLDWGPHDVSMALAVLGTTPDSASLERLPCASGELWEVSMTLGQSSVTARLGTGFESRKRRFEVRCGGRSAIYDDLRPKKLLVDGRPVRVAGMEPLRRAILSFNRFVTTGYADWRFDAGMVRNVMSVLLDPGSVGR